MDAREKEFLKRLRVTFKLEAEEHIQTMSKKLIELEKSPKDSISDELLEVIFREAHSMKGAARSVNLPGIESLCQILESVFSAIKNKEIEMSQELFDLFQKAIDELTFLLKGIDKVRTDSDTLRVDNLILKLKDASEGKPVSTDTKKNIVEIEEIEPEDIDDITASKDMTSVQPQTGNNPIITETVRIPTLKLDPLLLQAEELIMAKLSTSERIREMNELYQYVNSRKNEITKLRNRTTDRSELSLNEYLQSAGDFLNSIQSQISTITGTIEQDQRNLRRMVDEHLDSMKNILMLPVSTLVEGFPRFVRDISRNQGKEVEIEIVGKDIEVDKRILEELKDPLIHLIRNCVDHGIKYSENRINHNKSPKGKILLSFAARNGSQVEIIISDDGAGIDSDKIKAFSIKSGILSNEEAAKMNKEELLSLIFKSGFSTSPIITDISGRGLGLAIVREKVEILNGKISVESIPFKGTTFKIILPLTRATFRGLLVKSGNYLFIIPTLSVEQVTRCKPEDIKTIKNRETIKYSEHILPKVSLEDVLALPARNSSIGNKDNEYRNFVIIKSHGNMVAFEVDSILDECQIILKNLGSQLRKVKNIAGATILGSGKVVPVLNVKELIESATKLSPTIRATGSDIGEDSLEDKRILVVEDSITSRTLIRNILEAAGYLVKTAVDGADAFMQIRSDEFDLVVTDVDMPRMNGFELTTKIRNDKKYGEVPIILVTSLESREDRERGIEVGANAYIIKSNFEQSNLLEVINKLI